MDVFLCKALHFHILLQSSLRLSKGMFHAVVFIDEQKLPKVFLTLGLCA